MTKLRTIWLVLGALWITTVFYISLTPNPPDPVRFLNADKLEHALTYCLLMLWFAQVYQLRKQRVRVGLALVAMGVSMEFLQGMTGYRSFEYADMLANATGVLLGWAWASTAAGMVGIALERRFFKS
ncbi:MAG: VanZ family protein [Gallionella sp.]|jgi:VanZ family protein|nr:VanZ family protein [Gallionella sp.]